MPGEKDTLVGDKKGREREKDVLCRISEGMKKRLARVSYPFARAKCSNKENLNRRDEKKSGTRADWDERFVQRGRGGRARSKEASLKAAGAGNPDKVLLRDEQIAGPREKRSLLTGWEEEGLIES